MTMFGGLDVPDCLLGRDHAVDLLRTYLARDADGFHYSGAAFDTYPAPQGTENRLTDSDLVAVTMLRIRVTGHEALWITRYRADKISELLAQIPPRARIGDDDSGPLLDSKGPAWEVWKLLCEVQDRTKDKRLGAVAAGKLLARKRPDLIPIGDSYTKAVFKRKDPAADVPWWDDMRSAFRDSKPDADGMTLRQYLTGLRTEPGAEHLPLLRVLDILAWMHMEKHKTGRC